MWTQTTLFTGTKSKVPIFFPENFLGVSVCGLGVVTVVYLRSEGVRGVKKVNALFYLGREGGQKNFWEKMGGMGNI